MNRFGLHLTVMLFAGASSACVGAEEDIMIVEGEELPYDDDLETASDGLTNGTLRRGATFTSTQLTGSDSYCLNLYNSGRPAASARISWYKNGTELLTQGSSGSIPSRSVLRSVVVRPRYPFNRTSWISAKVTLLEGETLAWRIFPGRVITRPDGSQAVDCTR